MSDERAGRWSLRTEMIVLATALIGLVTAVVGVLPSVLDHYGGRDSAEATTEPVESLPATGTGPENVQVTGASTAAPFATAGRMDPEAELGGGDATVPLVVPEEEPATEVAALPEPPQAAPAPAPEPETETEAEAAADPGGEATASPTAPLEEPATAVAALPAPPPAASVPAPEPEADLNTVTEPLPNRAVLEVCGTLEATLILQPPSRVVLQRTDGAGEVELYLDRQAQPVFDACRARLVALDKPLFSSEPRARIEFTTLETP